MATRIERLEELYRLRRLALLAEQLGERVHSPGTCAAEIIRGVRARLEEIAQ